MPQNTVKDIIEFPPITVYGEEKDQSATEKTLRSMFNLANEPKDPYAIKRFPWGKKQAGGVDLEDEIFPLYYIIRDLLRMPEFVYDLTTHKLQAGIPSTFLGDQAVRDIKNQEMEEVADWMEYWYTSPTTKQRLQDMGHSDEEIEDIVERAANIEGMSWEDISKRPPDEDKSLAWLSESPPESEWAKVQDAGAWYSPPDDYMYAHPTNFMGYLIPKEEYQSIGAHELTHGIREEDKLTDKELKLLEEAGKTYLEYSDEDFINVITDPTGPFQPYTYKNLPLQFGGAWREERPRGGVQFHSKYFGDPSEIYSRIFQVRKYLDAKPGEYIDESDIENIKHYPAVNDLLRYMPIKKVQELLNTLAATEESKTVGDYMSEFV